MTDSTRPNETPDDVDLEDGEIESDNDETEVIIVEDKNVPSQNNAVNTATAPKNPFAQNPKNDAASSPLHKARDGVNKDKAVDG